MQTFIIEYGCLPIVVDISQWQNEKNYPLHTSDFATMIYLDVSYLSIHRYLTRGQNIKPFTVIAHLHHNSSYADIYIIQ